MTKRIPFFASRKTASGATYRFVPSPKYREKGFKTFGYYTGGTQLPHEDWIKLGFETPPTDLVTHSGRVMTLGEAIDTALIVNAAMLSQSQKAVAAGLRPKLRATAFTMNDLLDDYIDSPGFQKNKKITKNGYISKMVHIRSVFGKRRPTALNGPLIIDWFETTKEINGHTMAYKCFQTLRQAWKFGRARSTKWHGKLPDIEFSGLNIPTPGRRSRVISGDEFQALILAAETPEIIWEKTKQNGPAPQAHIGVADALFMAMATSLRQTDILQIHKTAIKGGKLHRTLEKSVRGDGSRAPTKVDIPLPAWMQMRIDQIIERHKMLGRTSPELILRDTSDMSYKCADGTNTGFSKHFAAVRKTAALICPSVKDVLYRDSRRTKIQRMADSGATLLEIRSHSGHTIKALHAVMEHYVPPSDIQAKAAATKSDALDKIDPAYLPTNPATEKTT